MATPESAVPVDVLREAVRARSEATSMRAVAAELGLSLGFVQDFIAGAQPRSRTLRAVTAWYVRHRAEAGDGLDADTMRAVLALLLEPVPVKARGKARNAFLDALERIYRDAGGLVPRWVGELRGG